MPTDDPAALALAELAAGIRECPRCRLCRGRFRAVPGEGPARPRLVVLGEAPGAQEDRIGQPFAGLAGKLLDSLLRENGLDRANLFITNSVKCRPPANRTPRRDELDICRTAWLDRQLALLGPVPMVLLGQVATQLMLGPDALVSMLHGTAQRDKDGRPCFVAYHPAAALRFAPVRAALKEDFAALARWLAEVAPISAA
jgi:DNA polymerase